MKVKIFLNVNISLTRLFVETKVKSSMHKNYKTEMKSIPDGKYLLKEAIYHRTLRNYSKLFSGESSENLWLSDDFRGNRS